VLEPLLELDSVLIHRKTSSVVSLLHLWKPQLCTFVSYYFGEWSKAIIISNKEDIQKLETVGV